MKIIREDLEKALTRMAQDTFNADDERLLKGLIDEYFLLLEDNKLLMKTNYTLLERIKRLEDNMR